MQCPTVSKGSQKVFINCQGWMVPACHMDAGNQTTAFNCWPNGAGASSGVGEWLSGLRAQHWLLFQRFWVQLSAPSRQLTTVYNSSSRGIQHLWPLWYLNSCTHTDIHTHLKNNKIFLKEWKAFINRVDFMVQLKTSVT